MGRVGNYLAPKITAPLHMNGGEGGEKNWLGGEGGVQGLVQISQIFLDFMTTKFFLVNELPQFVQA